MVWWLLSTSSGAAVILLMRWAFHLGTPARDWRALERWLESVERWPGRLRTWLAARIGWTDWHLQRLRERVQRGDNPEFVL